MALQLRMMVHSTQESVASAGALDPAKYSSVMTDGVAGVYTLADPANNFNNHGLLKYVRNDSAVTHTLTPTNFTQGTSMSVPANADVYLVWCYDDDESFAGSWGLCRFEGAVTIS